MPRLLLTMLSALVSAALLVVLSVGLLLILNRLRDVRASLRQIAMGVRAIEQQTTPLGRHTEALSATLGSAGGTVRSVADHLASADRSLDRAAPALQRRMNGGG